MACDDRADAYHTPDPCADTLDLMNKRLSHDLRVRVKRMQLTEPLTPDWLEMAEIVSHLGYIASMQAKDVGNSRDTTTAWERDELCVRFIIEEGKINVMLRAMVQFKEWWYESVLKGRSFDEDQMQRMRMFETGLSTLLRHSLSAAEALQTIDITLLLEHIQRVLQFATDPDSDWKPAVGCPPQGYQEVAVLGYLHALTRQAEKLADEDKVLGMIREKDIVPLVIMHYRMFRGLEGVGQDVVEDYIWFLSYLFDTEHFSAHRKEFLPDVDARKGLVQFEDAAKAVKAAEVSSGDAERRRKVRALCDQIIRCK
eukprot:Hpha_TRINITY_DN16735_c2_g7::TRINITY_DN16735_c2_g7_i1::g.76264::m.76264